MKLQRLFVIVVFAFIFFINTSSIYALSTCSGRPNTLTWTSSGVTGCVGLKTGDDACNFNPLPTNPNGSQNNIYVTSNCTSILACNEASSSDSLVYDSTKSWNGISCVGGTPTASLSISPKEISEGQTSYATLSSSNAQSCSVSYFYSVDGLNHTVIPASANVTSSGATPMTPTYGTLSFTTTCYSSTNGGGTASASDYDTLLVTKCGSSNGGTFSSPPNSNLCLAGSPSSVTTNSSTYTWQCGSTSNCSANKSSSNCPASVTKTWGSCSGQTSSTAEGSNYTITNVNAGYSGSATYSCNAGGTWANTPSASSCVVDSADGNITSATGCTIIPLGSTCSGRISWTTTNTTDPGIYNTTLGTRPYSIPSGTNQPIVIMYGPNTIDLKNSSTILDTKTISGVCTAGTSWIGGICTCPNGGINPSACDQCAPGQYYNGSSCNSCPPGKYCNGINPPVNCPADYYCPGGNTPPGGSNPPISCPGASSGSSSCGGSNCTSQTVNWSGGNCSGTINATNNGNQNSVTNVNGGYTGSATFSCNSGSYSYVTGTCTSSGGVCANNADPATFPACNVCPGGQYWDGANCPVCPANSSSNYGSVGINSCICNVGYTMSGGVCVPTSSAIDVNSNPAVRNGITPGTNVTLNWSVSTSVMIPVECRILDSSFNVLSNWTYLGWFNGVGPNKTYTANIPAVPGSYIYHGECRNQSNTTQLDSDFVTVNTTGFEPDLTASAITPTTVPRNINKSFNAPIINIGNAGTGSSFNSFIQWATGPNGSGDISNLPSSVIVELSSGAQSAVYTNHTFPEAGITSMRACADKNNPADTGSITESNESNNCGAWTNITVTTGNPSNPLIGGPVTRGVDENGNYGFTSDDPDNDSIRYIIDWDNNGTADSYIPSSAGFTGPGLVKYASHNWSSAGVKTFRARVLDQTGLYSGWSSFNVTVGALCSPGQYDNTGTCVPCTAGNYCDGTNPPTPCPVNTYCTGGNTPPADPTNPPTPCPNGTYSSTGSTNAIQCVAMTGTLSANPTNCSIPTDSSSCTINLTWVTNNPQGTSAITRNTPAGTVFNGNNGNNQPVTATTTTTYYLYNNAVELASTSVTVGCASTKWDYTGSVCADPQVVSVTPVGSYFNPIGSLDIVCSGSDWYTVTNVDTGTVIRSQAYIGPVSVPVTISANYSVICKHGTADSDAVVKYWNAPPPPEPTITIDAYPKTINSNNKSTINWGVQFPINSCVMTAQAVCANNTCSSKQLEAVATVNHTITSSNTDENDPNGSRPISSAVKTIITNRIGVDWKALGKKTFQLNNTTDFTITCGTKKATTRVRVANSSEQ